MNKSKEIRRILLGRITVNDAGMLVARPKGVYAQVNGLVDGYFSVLLFGVMERVRIYRWAGKKGQEKKMLAHYIGQIGQQLNLEEYPDVIACFTGRLVLTPTVVAGELTDGNKLKITVCTGRTPLGIARCFLVHERIKRLFGDLCEQEKKQKKQVKR